MISPPFAHTTARQRDRDRCADLFEREKKRVREADPHAASANVPPVIGCGTPVVVGKVSGKPARERTAR
jgi:hypothetical protein